MIMAGRGRRLGDFADPTKKLGMSGPFIDESPIDTQSLIRHINDINIADINPVLLSTIENIFKQLCTSKETMKNILSNLHCKALYESEFGEKLVAALEKIIYYEVDGTHARNFFLNFLQADFELKDTISQTDKQRHLNAIMLLGNFYHKIAIQSAPIKVLGMALLEYLNMLLKGSEKELQILATQIILNGKKFSDENFSQAYENLKRSIRDTLVNINLTKQSKCWLLLALDFISNDLKPLTGVIRDFYVINLGNEYEKLESLLESSSPPTANFDSSLESGKIIQGNLGKKNFEMNVKKKTNVKNNLSENISNLHINKFDNDETLKDKKKKNQSQHGKNIKTENQKWQSTSKLLEFKKGTSGHDDRFEKSEDFYGVQTPRMPKSENQKKNSEEK